jgi:hypothetical protein
LQQREQQQLDLNNQYQQFLEERGFPREQASNFAKLLTGIGSGQTVTQATGPDPGTLAQVVGLLAQGTGALGALGGSAGVSAGLNQVGGLLNSGIGALTDSLSGLFRGTTGGSAGPGSPGSVGGIDDAQFDLGQSTGFSPAAFFSNIGSNVASGFSSIFDSIFGGS